MTDEIFENRKLAQIYDPFDGGRDDLDHYVSIVQEFGAKRVIDIGSGTGCLAHRLSDKGVHVLGVEPAKASLVIARSKSGGQKIEWILGYATDLPAACGDFAVMTGNVAQIFVSDQSWLENLSAIHRGLNEKGYLVFEVRNPAKRDWGNWNREKTFKRVEIPEIGPVEGWCDVLEVSGPYVRFRWTYAFLNESQVLTSDSTLRFREKEEIETSLKESGFERIEVRDAPDRPGKEFVFISRRMAPNIAKDIG